MHASKVKQGGFSTEVFESVAVQNYLSETAVAFGFIGHEGRSVQKDRMIEEVLRGQGLAVEEIGHVLVSRPARHIGDAVAHFTRKTPDEVVIAELRRNLHLWRKELSEAVGRSVFAPSGEAERRAMSIRSALKVLGEEAAKLEARAAGGDGAAVECLRTIDVALDGIVASYFSM